MSTSRDAAATVTLVTVSQVVHFLTFGGIALFLPLIREDLHITFAQAGLISAAGTFTYACCQIPAGYLSDRLGPKRLFFVGLAAWSILCVALSRVEVFWAAIAVMLLAGIFRSLLFAPGLSLLSSWFPRERRATALSLFLVGSCVGTAILSLIGPLLAEHLGWRDTFASFALLGVATALAFGKIARDKPRAAAAERVRARDMLELLKHRIIWVCNALQFIRFSAMLAFSYWLPSLLVADRGFTLAAAGLIVALSAACAATSNALGGYVSDRLRNPPLVIGASLAVLACTCVLLVTVKSTAALLIVVAVTSVFLQFYFGPLFLVPLEVFGQRRAGIATGISNLCANTGGLLTAYALGVVKDKAGTFTWGFLGIAALCLVGVALSFVLARLRTRALAPDSRDVRDVRELSAARS